MTIAWVLGGGGLLGSALCCSLQQTGIELFALSERLRWSSETELVNQLRVAVKSFAAAAVDRDYWQIYWAAGIGTMHSSEEELAIETRVLSTLLNLIQSESRLSSVKGGFAFASSAGAIYAGSNDSLISENTPVSPTTAYAYEKLKQEKLLREFAISSCEVVVLLARLTTLYGAGQGIGKQQGLVAEMARRILRNQPVRIYVAFDTIRDYINSNDAASIMIASTHSLSGKIGVFTKIVASETPVTIAEIISIYRRISRRSPRIVVGTSKMSSIYSRRMQFISIAVPLDIQLSRTSLVIGIAQVMASERLAYMQGGINSNSNLKVKRL